MKKLLVLGFIVIICARVNAQNIDSTSDKTIPDQKELIIKNRLVTDFFYSYWYGLPEGIKQTNFNRGINVSLMYDMPIHKNSPFSFGLGIGVCNHNLYSNAYIHLNDEYKLVMEKLPEGLAYKVNKLSLTYVHIPLEFRYFDKKSEFKICVGVRVGVMAGAHNKYVGPHNDILQYQTGSSWDVRIKNNKLPNKTKIPVEICMHTGWKYFDFNISYTLKKYFEDGNPQIYPLSLGISIALW